ncbi:hypothetical protein KIN20_014051 [Parelaphostrongylus tenuis]|uniref:Uncharacterized protein n=1 Tax=Parelaphostrongylus tenuis TaxID=148309 RepID=A0AAD5QP53_PARTN|nr:hypothetical protein KIN20_014051 [Parelaphostrongylus tenuis]
MDSIVVLLKKPEQDTQLLCFLDVLCATIRCARNAEPWQTLGVDGHELEIRISMIASYLLSCRVPHVLETVVVPSISSALFTKLSSLHDEFAGVSSEDTSTLAVAYCSILLKVSICALRSHSSSTEMTTVELINGEVSAHFHEAAIELCSNLSSDPRSWNLLMETPGTSMRILLVLGCVIRRIEKDSGDTSLVSTALKLIGQYAAFDSYHQLSCILGGQRSILSAVASLPVYFLTRASLRVPFLSALIAMTYECSLASQLLLDELSEKHVIKFITEAQEGKSSNIDVLQKTYAAAYYGFFFEIL